MTYHCCTTKQQWCSRGHDLRTRLWLDVREDGGPRARCAKGVRQDFHNGAATLFLLLATHKRSQSITARPWWGGGGLAQGHGVSLFAFGGAYWPLALAHSDPLWVRTCFGFNLVSTEPLDDLSCLTGVGCPRDGLLPVPLTRCIQMHTPSPCWVCRLQH